jgi:hypothetical protein
VTGDGALLRLSNGAPVAVNRVNIPANAYGVLRIESGASLKADDFASICRAAAEAWSAAGGH